MANPRHNTQTTNKRGGRTNFALGGNVIKQLSRSSRGGGASDKPRRGGTPGVKSRPKNLPQRPAQTRKPRRGLKAGGKAFPDHSGDGKITQKDILMAKGVIPKSKK